MDTCSLKTISIFIE